MATADVWTDFEVCTLPTFAHLDWLTALMLSASNPPQTVRHNVKHNTVDRLKQILNSFNEQCGTNFTKSGKKQELIDRITRELDAWRRQNNTDKWTKAKGILNQVRNTT